MTTTVHFPARTAFRLVPTKAQFLLPFVMLMRIVPTDRFGMAIDTDAASFAALTSDPRRITIGRVSDTTFGATLASTNTTGASVVLVVRDEIGIEVVVGATVVEVVEADDVEVVLVVVGATVVEVVEVDDVELVVEVVVVGRIVVEVVLVLVVVGATVVEVEVVLVVVVVVDVVEVVLVLVVVVGTIFRVSIAVAVETFDCVPIPN